MSANEGWLETALRVMVLVQMCVQGVWHHESPLLSLPFFEEEHIVQLNKALKRGRERGRHSGVETIDCLPELLAVCERDSRFLSVALQGLFQPQEVSQVKFVRCEVCMLIII